MRIQRTVPMILARPAAARAVLTGEMALTNGAVEQAFAQKTNLRDLWMTDDESMSPQDRTALREFMNMSPSMRDSVRVSVQRRIATRFAIMDRVFDRPEREWGKGLADIDEPSAVHRDFGDLLMSILSPAFSGYAVASVRVRTQLRLLDLHAKLIQYQWDYGRLPDKFDGVDPLTDEPYVYERRADGTVRLVSKGIPETGEIELRYRRTVRPDQAGEKP